MLQKKQLEDLIRFRQELHRNPEVSGEESRTADRVRIYLEQFGPDRIVENIGGNGLIAEFSGKEAGPSLMFRCELDALPIPEKSDLPYRSEHPDKGHLCGHDGHMAMVAGLGSFLNENRPKKGRVLLLFQPAEETGTGAEKMISDPKFREFEPDMIFAIHNLPGIPLHQVVSSERHFAAASSGMRIQLHGKSSHAAEPEKGNNPGFAMARIIIALEHLLEIQNFFKDFVLITPIHARLGTIAFGTSPGEGIILLTLRSYLDRDMDRLKEEISKLAGDICRETKLELEISYEEVFPATVNNKTAAKMVEKAAKDTNLPVQNIEEPFRWSEDFGHFTSRYPGALFGLGSGKDQPALHNPDFDFPDELIPTGTGLYMNICKQYLDFKHD